MTIYSGKRRNFAPMIFYFSGTGNTKWVAQQLADATGDKLYNIADEMNVEAEKAQLAARYAYLPYQAMQLIEDNADVTDNRANFQ